MKKRTVMFLAAVGICLCVGWGIAQTIGKTYVLYGKYLFPATSFINSSGARVDTINYIVSGTSRTFNIKTGNGALATKDTLDKFTKHTVPLAQGTRTDTLLLDWIDAPWFTVGVTFKCTPDSGSGTLDSVTFEVRDRLYGHDINGRNDITGTSYRITPDSMSSGWWAGKVLVNRSSFFGDTAFVRATLTDNAILSDYKPLVRVPTVNERGR